jgi:hypothetical protein
MLFITQKVQKNSRESLCIRLLNKLRFTRESEIPLEKNRSRIRLVNIAIKI